MHPFILAEQAELATVTRFAGLQAYFARQQHRLLETHAHFIASGRQARAQFGQGAALVPQAVGNRARKAEQFVGSGKQMDRVVVAGDARVAPADICWRAPVGQGGLCKCGFGFTLGRKFSR